MILRLDKGDVKEVFKEFVDTATRNYINNKIKKLFDQRVKSIVESTLEKADLEQMIQNKINYSIDEYFKINSWSSECEYINKLIEKKLKEINFKRLINKKFSDEISKKLFKNLKFNIK